MNHLPPENPQMCGLTKFVTFAGLLHLGQFADLRTQYFFQFADLRFADPNLNGVSISRTIFGRSLCVYEWNFCQKFLG